MRTAEGGIITRGLSTTEQPRAIIMVFEAGSGILSFVARCPCGWTAAASATDAQKAKVNLQVLVDAHRRTCARVPRES